jgi:hypothetical protein
VRPTGLFLFGIDYIQIYNQFMAKKTKKPSRKKDVNQAAIDYGIDIYAIKDNLKSSPAERIRRHQIALNIVEKFRKAKFI